MQKTCADCPSRSKTFLARTGWFLAGMLVAGGFVVLSAFGGGWHGHHGRHHGDPERMRAFIDARVEDALDDLDATPQQRERLHAVKNRMLESARGLHGNPENVHAALLEEWRKDRPDAARLHALVDAKAEQMRKLAHEAVDSGVEVHGILTPEQRAKVTRKMERHSRLAH